MKSATGQAPHWRKLRSFVLREGRFTPAQQRAMARLWPHFGVDVDERTGVLEGASLFGRAAPLVLEIGFGNGDSLAQQAAAEPEKNFLGIEVHRPGVGRLLQTLEENAISNVRVICHDAVEVLQHHLASGGIDRLQLFFPDPWPKKKHHKRRIVQPAFVDLVAGRLGAGGIFHLATDWENYAEHMMQVLSASQEFENIAGPGRYAERPALRPLTRFERRGQNLGHGVWDLLFRRRPGQS